MNNRQWITVLSLGLAVMACTIAGVGTPPPFEGSLEPISVGDDLTQIDLCAAIPREAVEGARGRMLVGDPVRTDNFFGAPGVSGCSYDFGHEGYQHFGYIVLMDGDFYRAQPRVNEREVPGLGSEAFFTDAAGIRQLWVRMGPGLSFVVAFGEEANEEAALALGRLLAEALQ